MVYCLINLCEGSERVKVHLLYDGTYASNSYIVYDDAETGAVLIDPSVSPKRAVGILANLPPISMLILTHSHFDHMLAIDEWRELTGAPLAVSEADSYALANPMLSCFRGFLGEERTFAPAEVLLKSGDVIPVGGEQLTVTEVPGHTPGCIILDSGELLFTGDTVFAGGGYGRYDLPGGDGSMLVQSIGAIMRIAGERRILAGHGEEGLLSAEKKFYNFS